MKKGLTEIVFILDKSGSMMPLAADTVGGFNGIIEKQKRIDGECLVTTVLFNDYDSIIHDRKSLHEMVPLTYDDYIPCGTTALLDAIGNTIHHVTQKHLSLGSENFPEHMMFFITTDGMENASKIYSYEDVKHLIEVKKDCGWEFVFYGANIDAFSTAESLGIDRNRASSFVADPDGIAARDDDICNFISMIRR